MSNDICPIMSRPVQVVDSVDGENKVIVHEVPCIEHRCHLWIEVFTTELIRTSGCAYELMPVMVDGQLRV